MVARKKATAPAETPEEVPLEEDGPNERFARARDALFAAGYNLDDIIYGLVPDEADDLSIRKARRPTAANLKKATYNVVMLLWDKAYSLDIDYPVDRDSEGFDDFDEAVDYWEKQKKYSQDEMKLEVADEFNHLVVFFKDSADLTDRHIDIYTKDATWKTELKERIESGDLSFIFSGKTKPKTDGPKEKDGKKSKPLPKAGQVTKKKAPSKAAAKLTADDADTPKTNAASLNKRVAAMKEKRAAAKTDTPAAPVKAATKTAAPRTARKRPVKQAAAA